MSEATVGYCTHCGRPIEYGDYFWATSYGLYCSSECIDQADAARLAELLASDRKKEKGHN